MKFLKAVGWLLYDSLLWAKDLLVHLARSIVRALFTREGLCRHWVKITLILLIVAAGALAYWFLSKKYEFIVIPKDAEKQTMPERIFLNSRQRPLDPMASGRSGAAPDPAVRKISLRGSITQVEDDRLTVLTTDGREESVLVNEKTRIMPGSEKLAVGQKVSITAYPENGQNVANRITVRRSETVPPKTEERED